MDWKVPLCDISFGPEEHQAVKRVLDSGWLSMGPETELFESEFARHVGARRAVAVSSGTAALHLALLALGIGPGDEVIVPSLTFVATANAVLYVGATPVFADVTSPKDLTVCPDVIESKITSKTVAVIVMHYGGFPCRMDQIKSIADKHNLKIVEDAAHAPGAIFRGRSLGTWGAVGCFSFFSNKNMTTGEGGMLVTGDDEVAARLKNLRSHGMTSVTWDRHKGHSFSYDVVRTGYNYRIDEIRAALGRVQLTKLDENNARRRAITRRMRESLKQIDFLEIPFSDNNLDECSCHIFPILLDSADKRRDFMETFKTAGIQTSIHYPPVHRFGAYAALGQNNSVPVTEDVAGRVVTLPLFPTMTHQQMDMVVQTASKAVSRG